MNKNNRGFTLIEMLVTIAIVGVLGVIIGINIVGMISRQKEKNYEEYKENIENAACLYFQRENPNATECAGDSCQIQIPTLIQNGFVKKDMSNPITKESAENDGNYVEVSWSDGERICTYKEMS